MKTRLRMKCKQCGKWTSIEVNKVMLNSESGMEKEQVLPLKEEKCAKCGTVIAEEKTLIRILKS